MRNFEEGRGGGEQETGRIGRIGRRGGGMEIGDEENCSVWCTVYVRGFDDGKNLKKKTDLWYLYTTLGFRPKYLPPYHTLPAPRRI